MNIYWSSLQYLPRALGSVWLALSVSAALCFPAVQFSRVLFFDSCILRRQNLRQNLCFCRSTCCSRFEVSLVWPARFVFKIAAHLNTRRLTRSPPEPPIASTAMAQARPATVAWLGAKWNDCHWHWSRRLYIQVSYIYIWVIWVNDNNG